MLESRRGTNLWLSLFQDGGGMIGEVDMPEPELGVLPSMLGVKFFSSNFSRLICRWAFFRLTHRIERVAGMDRQIATVANTFVNDTAFEYASRTLARTSGDKDSKERPTGPASRTALADRPVFVLAISLVSVLTKTFSPMDTAIALVETLASIPLFQRNCNITLQSR